MIIIQELINHVGYSENIGIIHLKRINRLQSINHLLDKDLSSKITGGLINHRNETAFNPLKTYNLYIDIILSYLNNQSPPFISAISLISYLYSYIQHSKSVDVIIFLLIYSSPSYSSMRGKTFLSTI